MTINDFAHFAFLLQGYQASDKDVDSVDADVNYYGYVNKFGAWYIMKEDLSVGGDADLNSWRYAKGSSGYSANWANREGLTYERFDEAFI